MNAHHSVFLRFSSLAPFLLPPSLSLLIWLDSLFFRCPSVPCIVTEGYFWQIVDSSLLRFQVIQGLSGVIGQLGRQGPAATLGQHCNQWLEDLITVGHYQFFFPLDGCKLFAKNNPLLQCMLGVNQASLGKEEGSVHFFASPDFPSKIVTTLTQS